MATKSSHITASKEGRKRDPDDLIPLSLISCNKSETRPVGLFKYNANLLKIKIVPDLYGFPVTREQEKQVPLRKPQIKLFIPQNQRTDKQKHLLTFDFFIWNDRSKSSVSESLFYFTSTGRKGVVIILCAHIQCPSQQYPSGGEKEKPKRRRSAKKRDI